VCNTKGLFHPTPKTAPAAVMVDDDNEGHSDDKLLLKGKIY
jgi:hypothetical protein